MKILLNNEEGKEITLVEYSHMTLKNGLNELEISPRRLNIAIKEIIHRELKIEVIKDENKIKEAIKNAGKIKNKRKEEDKEPDAASSNE